MTSVELKVRLVVESVPLLVVKVVEPVVVVLVLLDVVLEEDELNGVPLLVLVVLSGMLMVEKVLVVRFEVLDEFL